MIDTNTKQAIIDTYIKGEKVKSICALYNISMPTLYKFLRSADVPRTRPTGNKRGETKGGCADLRYKAIVLDAENGLNVPTLARKHGCCTQTVYRALRAYNTRAHRPPTPLMLNIRQALKDGEKPATIAANYGCSRQYVYLVKDASN